MKNASEISMMAAYSTFKILYDEKKYKSPYQLLAEFVRYIFANSNKVSYEVLDMKCMLKEFFCFDIPEAVVKTTLNTLKDDGVVLSNGMYSIPQSLLENDSRHFEKTNEDSQARVSDLITAIKEFIKEKECEVGFIGDDVLMKSLVSFFVENDSTDRTTKYYNYIAEFVVRNKDKSIAECLKDIREGSLLYMGLNARYDKEAGSGFKPLTLFLDTEILFDLGGYNGDIFKILAEDFLKQVKEVNAKSDNKIKLVYFPEVKREIDYYFNSAEAIVEKKTQTIGLNKSAMNIITQGCNSASSIVEKKEKFFSMLRSYRINEDEKDDYYDSKYEEYNRETFGDLEGDNPEEREQAVKFVSNINKLRKGEVFYREIDSRFLLVTRTKTVLRMSEEKVKEIKKEKGIELMCGFAVSLDRITSLLWGRLWNGFGGQLYPATADAAVKAKIVLSSTIARKIDDEFKKTKEDYEAKRITLEQMAGVTLALKEKMVLPEDLMDENLDEIMDFSPAYLSRYQVMVEKSAEAIAEKDKEIKRIRQMQNKAIAEKENIIDVQKKQIEEKNAETCALIEEIKRMKEEKRKRDETLKNEELKRSAKKEKRKRIVKTIVFWILVIGCIVACVVLSCKLKEYILSRIAAGIGIFLFFVWAYEPIKKFYFRLSTKKRKK